MKILSAFIVITFFNVIVAAQNAKVVAEVISSRDGVVKNAPFSADAVSESVQVLADGNRIVRTATTKLYRNSEGRFRRDIQGSSGGVLNSFYTTGQGVMILDPEARQRYMLDLEAKIARVGAIKTAPTIIFDANKQVTEEQRAAAAAKLAEELKASVVSVKRAESNSKIAEELAVAAGSISQEGVVAYHSFGSAKYETRTEQLGSQIIEGVDAEGTRTYTTIPAGAIGNERPIEIVYERWYSKELQMTVYSKHTDPRFGEQTYRLTNIVRSEPDPSLFTVPQGYKISQGSDPVYTVTNSRPSASQNRVVRTSATSNKP